MHFEPSSKVEIHGEELMLLPEKAIYWKKNKTLILGDLHLGKVSHFRKNGIALSEKAQFETLKKLQNLLTEYEIERLLFLGDLFHSSTNSEWSNFELFIKNNSTISFELIIGNHDIIDKSEYLAIGVNCFDERIIPPFLFVHEPKNSTSNYVVSAHMHPGVKLKGKGKQSIMLPCFHFGEKQAIIPAFGTLTGLSEIKAKKSDCVFAVANGKTIPLS